MTLANTSPLLYLIAPALRIHPATETVLRYLSPEIEWNLIAVGEDWRRSIEARGSAFLKDEGFYRLVG